MKKVQLNTEKLQFKKEKIIGLTNISSIYGGTKLVYSCQICVTVNGVCVTQDCITHTCYRTINHL